MKRISLHPAVVVAIAAAGMLVVASGGPDFGRYRAWTFAFINVDLFAIGSSVGSPLGLPVTTWSHAPGAFFALPLVVLGPVAGVADAPLIAGWASSLVFWWAFFRLLQWAARGNLPLVALGLGAAYVGTHAGFYTRAHASESLALAAVALLTLAVVEPDERPVRGCWLIGCASAMLFLTRTYYVVYALPALVIAADRVLHGGRWFGTGVSAGTEPDGSASSSRLLSAVALAGPLTAAVVQQALVNRWMTGSALASTYVYGDATYRSMDWLAPQLSAVLLHPWHGLLVYHPLYAVGFAALLSCWWTTSRPTELLLWSGGILAVLVNLWVQGAWHFWWLGTGTFGMRGMAAAAVLVVAALIRVLADRLANVRDGARREAARREAGAWLLASVVCSLWSMPLLVLGNTQLYTWNAVIEAQLRGLDRLARTNWLLGLGIAAVLVIGVLARTLHRRAARRAEVPVAIGAVVLGGLALGDVLTGGYRAVNSGSGVMLVFPGAMLLVAVGAGFLLWRALGEAVTGTLHRRRGALEGSLAGQGGTVWREAEPRDDDTARRLVTFAVGCVFTISAVLFARLAIDTERRLARGDLPDVSFAYTATYQIQIAINSLREYQRVRGFEDRKQALREFLRSQGARVD